MPPLSFMKRWKSKVLSGEKRQTIRPVGKRIYRPGDILYLFTDLRQKQCERLGWAECTGVTRLRRLDRAWWQRKEGRKWINLGGVELARLAYDDGFDEVHEFQRWFAVYPPRQTFNLIKWDKLRKGKPA